MLAAFISLMITIGLIVLSLAFQIAGKLRLTLPLLYFLAAVISTFFTDWTTKNETLVLTGFFVLCGLVVVSWIVTLIKTIVRRVRGY